MVKFVGQDVGHIAVSMLAQLWVRMLGIFAVGVWLIVGHDDGQCFG